MKHYSVEDLKARNGADVNALYVLASDHEKEVGTLLDALKHTLKVFHSMADRGDYPLELLEFSPSSLNKFFLGKRGFQYALDAIKTAEPEFDSFKFRQSLRAEFPEAFAW